MQKRYEEIIERQRGIWTGCHEAWQVIDCFEEELKQLGVRPVQTPPEPPQNTWLTKLRDRLKNPTPQKKGYGSPPPHTGMARIIAKNRDLHDVLQHATLAEVEDALTAQRRYVEDLHYAHRDANELLQDMYAIKHGTAGF